MRNEEVLLVKALLQRAPAALPLIDTLSSALVFDMNDGGMGSIQFGARDDRSMGSQLIETTYVDADEVLVSISINLDKDGNLFEVDLWKVNFAPLCRYPKPSELN